MPHLLTLPRFSVHEDDLVWGAVTAKGCGHAALRFPILQHQGMRRSTWLATPIVTG